MTGPSLVRRTFLDAADIVVVLLDDPAVDASWTGASVLPDLSIGALAAHLGRSVLQVHRYLEAEPARGPVGAASASHYFALADGIDDRSSPLSRGVVDRGRTEAEAGASALRTAVRHALVELARALPAEPADRLVAPLGVTMVLDEYLGTRFVEICVHVDDLAHSLGIEPPPLPAAASQAAIDVLVATAVLRHGGAAVLRALTRRERDGIGALRVF